MGPVEEGPTCHENVRLATQSRTNWEHPPTWDPRLGAWLHSHTRQQSVSCAEHKERKVPASLPCLQPPLDAVQHQQLRVYRKAKSQQPLSK